MQLKNKTIILTGASSGLGKALAIALVAKGAKVYGIARRLEKLEELHSQLGDLFIPINLDITQENQIKDWVAANFNQDNIPDVLINNAGLGSFHKIDEMDSKTWLDIINVNLNGMFYLTAAVAKLLKQKNEHSHIVNIGSILGKVGRVDASAYCTAKFGLQGFSEALRMELRPYKVKLTCVNPGSIETDFLQSSGIQAHSNMLHPDDLAQTIIHILETPDNMQIDDITIRPLDPRTPH